VPSTSAQYASNASSPPPPLARSSCKTKSRGFEEGGGGVGLGGRVGSVEWVCACEREEM
jgi:hypothetical protein